MSYLVLKIKKSEVLMIGEDGVAISPTTRGGGSIKYPSSVTLKINSLKPVYRRKKTQEELDADTDYIVKRGGFV